MKPVEDLKGFLSFRFEIHSVDGVPYWNAKKLKLMMMQKKVAKRATRSGGKPRDSILRKGWTSPPS